MDSIEDVTDPGLLKVPLTITSLSSWFCLHKSVRGTELPGAGIPSRSLE